MTKQCFLYLFILTCCPMLLLAQQTKKVTGNIISSGQLPISGASIQLKSTRTTVTAREDGSFTMPILTLPDTLTISAVGYTTHILPLRASNFLPLTITLLEKTSILEEVVVNTGYQKIPKERATGSFTQLSNQLYNEQVGTNVLARLESITNGLTVSRRINSNGQFLVRGLSTLTGPKDPLIILDDFPYNGNINNINPNDVESVTVLKDAAAASIWGTRAGNGVIVITTKKGSFNRPLQIEFNSNITVTAKSDLFYLPTMSASDFVDVEQLLFSKSYRFSDTALTSRPPFSPVYELLFKQRNGQLSAIDATAQINAFRNHDIRDDLLRNQYQPAINQQYALTLRGGSANFNWLLSGGADRNVNELAALYNRLNLRSENTFKVGNNLSFTGGIYITQSKGATGKPGYSDLSTVKGRLPTYTKLVDDKGLPLALAKDYRQVYTDTAGAGKLLDWNYYPLSDYTHINNTTAITSLLANAGVHYRFLHDFGIGIHYQYERQDSKNRNLQDADSYTARDIVNRYSQLNRATGTVTYKVPIGGVMDLSNSLLEAQNIRGQLDWSKYWGKHRLSVLLGSELRDIKNSANSFRTYGYNDDLLTSANIDFANPYPSFLTGSTAFIPSGVGFSATNNRFVSFFGNAAYTFLGKYTLSGSMRRDASNTFGVATNDKWTPLWSTGAAWDISKETWYRLPVLPYLKLRATYGISGNVDPSKSAVTTINYGGTSPFTLTPFANIDKYYNPDLRWEKTGMLNLALDFKTKGNRISGSIDYYQKNCTDLYGTAVIDYTAGLGTATIVKNIASMKAQGLDIELNSLNITGVFQWRTQAILNYSKDEITKNYVASKQGSSFVGDGYTGLEGSPVFAAKSYRWAGLDPLNGDPQGYLNGQISKDYNLLTGNGTQINDLVFNGTVLPKLYGSLGNTFSWKGLSLTVRLTYKFGYVFRRSSISYSDLYASSQGHPDYALRWQKPGDEIVTDIPSLIYPAVGNRDSYYKNSEVLIEKGDHIRLQYITIAYELPSPLLKTWCKSLSIYTNINNLGILWKANHKGLDPDYAANVVPLSKSVAVGIRANF